MDKLTQAQFDALSTVEQTAYLRESLTNNSLVLTASMKALLDKLPSAAPQTGADVDVSKCVVNYAAEKFAVQIDQLVKHGIEFLPFTEKDYETPDTIAAWWAAQPGLATTRTNAVAIKQAPAQHVWGTKGLQQKSVGGVLSGCTFAKVEHSGEVFTSVMSGGQESLFKMGTTTPVGGTPLAPGTPFVAWVLYTNEEREWIAYKAVPFATEPAAVAYTAENEMKQVDVSSIQEKVLGEIAKKRAERKAGKAGATTVTIIHK